VPHYTLAMRWLVATVTAMGLSTCGRSGLTLPTSATQGGYDCVAACEQLTGELVRDFGVPAQSVHCHDERFQTATTCQGCADQFHQQFGVVTSGCP